jgi:TPP-dependent pyruvate/acetoin dehydrogenase alpha subunit
MLEIRMFELKAQELYRRGFFLGILTSSEKAQS